jgi:hypothetical protein
VGKHGVGSQQTTCISNTDVTKVGDGNPHQNFFHKQISVSEHFAREFRAKHLLTFVSRKPLIVLLPLSALLAKRILNPSPLASLVAATAIGLVQVSTCRRASLQGIVTSARVPKAIKSAFGTTLPILHVSFWPSYVPSTYLSSNTSNRHSPIQDYLFLLFAKQW